MFGRVKLQMDVYIAEYSPKGPHLSTPRRLMLDDADALPFDWTPDYKAVFLSNRTGAVFDIVRQKIDEASAEMLIFGPEQKTICRLNSDGSQILYMVPTNPGASSQAVRLMRAPISGGPPQTVIEAPNIANYQCSRAPARICVLGQAEPEGFVFSVFDPVNGNRRELAKLSREARDSCRSATWLRPRFGNDGAHSVTAICWSAK